MSRRVREDRPGDEGAEPSRLSDLCPNCLRSARAASRIENVGAGSAMPVPFEAIVVLRPPVPCTRMPGRNCIKKVGTVVTFMVVPVMVAVKDELPLNVRMFPAAPAPPEPSLIAAVIWLPLELARFWISVLVSETLLQN